MSYILAPPHPFHPNKRARRTATAVLAGYFDARPTRDVLTGVLKGVPRYEVVEQLEDQQRLARKRERREQRAREKERARVQQLADAETREAQEAVARHVATGNAIASSSAKSTVGRRGRWSDAPSTAPALPRSSSGRPASRLPFAERDMSASPPPPYDRSSRAVTPVPSITSATTLASSKRPHTPDDGLELYYASSAPPLSTSSQSLLPRKKRAAARKGWKGWVEGSPPPSDKLINLDAAPTVTSRRTRSGRNFDG